MKFVKFIAPSLAIIQVDGFNGIMKVTNVTQIFSYIWQADSWIQLGSRLNAALIPVR